MVAAAAVLRRVELRASTLARHHRAAPVHHPQLLRAVPVNVRHAAGVLAVPAAAGRPHTEPHIVTVDEADVVEIHGGGAASDGKLHQADRRSPTAGAFQYAAAVAGRAAAVTGAVKIATCSGPETPRPARRRWELYSAAGSQCEAAVAEDGGSVAGECARPDCVVTAVLECENRRRNITNNPYIFFLKFNFINDKFLHKHNLIQNSMNIHTNQILKKIFAN